MAGPKLETERPTAEELAEFKLLVEEHQRKWRVARETGNYAELLVDGEHPTAFKMRPIPSEVLRKMQDLHDAKTLGENEAALIAFRAALVDIVNAGDLKVTRVKDPAFGQLVSLELINALDAFDRNIVTELGGVALTSGLNPKS